MNGENLDEDFPEAILNPKPMIALFFYELVSSTPPISTGHTNAYDDDGDDDDNNNDIMMMTTVMINDLIGSIEPPNPSHTSRNASQASSYCLW